MLQLIHLPNNLMKGLTLGLRNKKKTIPYISTNSKDLNNLKVYFIAKSNIKLHLN